MVRTPASTSSASKATATAAHGTDNWVLSQLGNLRRAPSGNLPRGSSGPRTTREPLAGPWRHLSWILEQLRDAGRSAAPPAHGSSAAAEGYEDAGFTSRPPQSGPAVVTKHKVGLPFRVRFALNEDGWISRADVVWHKPSVLPSSVKDRVGTRYEMLFHL